MSVNAMNRSEVAKRSASGEAPQTKTLEELVRYIPTEIITLYLAAIALATPMVGGITAMSSDYTGRWITFFVALAVTPLFVVSDFLAKAREQGTSRKLPVYNIIAAAIAFAAWGFALPASPFGDLSWYSAGWAGFVALAASIVLGRLGAALGKPSP